MAQKTLSVKLSLNDKQFQSSLKKATRSMKKFGGNMKSFGQTLSRNVTLPIIALGAASVAAFDKQAKAVSQVEAGLTSTGNAAGFTSEQLQKMAADLQSVTIFGDEEILKNATAQILTFTNIANEQFTRTQLAALNLATRLDGDLKSASIQLGKALNDPISNLSALSRSGIQFSEEQKAIIKSLAQTNRLAEAQTIILDELDKQYGGAAEAAADAGLGGFQQLQNALSDVSEAFGKIIVDNLEPLKEGLQSVTEFLSKLTDEQKKNVIEFGAILAIVGPVIVVFGSLITAISTLIPLFTAIAGAVSLSAAPFIAIAAAVGFFIKRIGDLQKEYEEYNKVVGDFEPMQEAFIPTAITPTTPTNPSIQRSTIPERIEPIKAMAVALKEVKNEFETLKPIVEKFEESLSGMDIVANDITQSFQSFGNVFQSVFAQALQSQEGFFKSFVEGTKRALAALAAQIASMLILNALLGSFGIGKLLGFQNIGGIKGIGQVISGVGSVDVNSVGAGGNLRSMMNNGSGVEVFGTLRGADIILSSDRAKNNRTRTRGY